jgi:hypothetical protein
VSGAEATAVGAPAEVEVHFASPVRRGAAAWHRGQAEREGA